MLAERWTGPCHGTYRYSDHDVRAYRWWPNGLPVFDDPATLGCLLALVREAYDARLHVRARANKWRCYSGVTPVGEWSDSEAEALVAALEAAP